MMLFRKKNKNKNKKTGTFFGVSNVHIVCVCDSNVHALGCQKTLKIRKGGIMFLITL